MVEHILIEPSFLQFDLQGDREQQLDIVNFKTPYHPLPCLAFRVRTTAPERCFVNPASNVIKPGHRMSLRIKMKLNTTISERQHRSECKLLLQMLWISSEGDTAVDAKELLSNAASSEAEKQSIMERLIVCFETAHLKKTNDIINNNNNNNNNNIPIVDDRLSLLCKDQGEKIDQLKKEIAGLEVMNNQFRDEKRVIMGENCDHMPLSDLYAVQKSLITNLTLVGQAIEKRLQQNDDRRLCKICLIQPFEIALVHTDGTAHLCVCQGCFQKITNSRCPICNCAFVSGVKIFSDANDE
jgi:hypothetical protein